MSHHDDNLYTILGRLAALQPKPEIKTSKEAAKKIYESVEARGSILSGVDTVQAKLAKQFAMERDESKLKKGHCSDCDCSPCRCKKCNECGVLESKCRCKPDMTEGAVKDSLYMELSQVARDEDYPKLSKLMSDSGTVGRYLQQQIEEITSENGLHPDDDFEPIETQLMARLQRDFGDDDEMEEGWKQTLRLVDPTIKARILKKSQDQTNQGLDTIQHLADLDLTSDDMVSRAMKPNTYFKRAERYAKLANKGVAEVTGDSKFDNMMGDIVKGAVTPGKKVATKDKIGEDIWKMYELFYSYGDSGFDYLDKHTAYWDALFTKHNGDIDALINSESEEKLMIVLKELQDANRNYLDRRDNPLSELASSDNGGGIRIQAKYLGKENFKVVINGESYLAIIENLEGNTLKGKSNTNAYKSGNEHMWDWRIDAINITNNETGDELDDDMTDVVADYIGEHHQADLIKIAIFQSAQTTSWHDQRTRDMGYIVQPTNKFNPDLKKKKPGVAEGSSGKNQLKQEIKELEKQARHLSFEPAQTDPETGHGYRPNYIKTVRKIEKLKAQLKSLKGVAEGETVVKGNVSTHKGTYGNEYQGDPDDDDGKPTPKAPKVSNSKTGKRGRPTGTGKNQQTTGRKYDHSALSSILGGSAPKNQVKGKVHTMDESVDQVARRLTEGVNLLELLKEKHQTVDEMLAELSTDIANFKESGHCSELLKDCMDIKGAHKKAQPFTALEIAPAHAITPAATRLPHQFNAPQMEMKMDRELNELARLAGLSEDCGDMPPIGIAMQDMQSEQDNLSISTTYNSRDGKKTISVNADGKQAEDLLQMLRIAGLGSGEKAQELQARPEIEFDNIDGEVSTVPQDDLEELSTEQSPMILGGPGDAEMDEAEFDVPATEPVNGPKPEYQTMKQSTMGPGEGDPGEKAMHPDRPTNNNGDNALSTPATPPTRAQKTLIAVSTLESKLAAEYESIKKSK